jgi:hypothetical protein
MVVTQTATLAPTTCRLFIRGEQKRYGDFRDDLIRDGFAIVKGAIPRDRADEYADKMFSFLEDL